MEVPWPMNGGSLNSFNGLKKKQCCENYVYQREQIINLDKVKVKIGLPEMWS